MKRTRRKNKPEGVVGHRKRATKERLYHRERYYAMRGAKKRKRRLFGVILQHCMDVLNDKETSANRKDRICRWALPYVAHKVTDPARLVIAARKIKHRERRAGFKDKRGGRREERKTAAEAAVKKKTGKWGNLLAGAGVERGNDIRV